jgi:hypothetical protein
MILWKISPAMLRKKQQLYPSFKTQWAPWIFIRPDSELIWESVCACAKLFVDEDGTNRIVEEHIGGFYTKTTQKGEFSKLCVKIKKRCYTDLLHFSTCKHNLVSFFVRIIFWQ